MIIVIFQRYYYVTLALNGSTGVFQSNMQSSILPVHPHCLAWIAPNHTVPILHFGCFLLSSAHECSIMTMSKIDHFKYYIKYQNIKHYYSITINQHGSALLALLE